MSVLMDVNLSPDWVTFLESAGIEAIHRSTVGISGAPDTDIVAYAVRSGPIVLTQDLDFGTILSATQGIKPSVVQMRAGRVNPLLFGAQVLIALCELADKPREGVFIPVEKKRTRLTLLPLLNRED